MDFEYLGFTADPPHLIDYQQAWQHQREVLSAVADGTVDSRVVFVEHASVYTAGRRTTDDQKPFDGTPVIDVDRGGLITWHGPGQLVGYPIVRLPDGVGVVDYVRRIEEAIIGYLATFGLAAGRIPDRTGVWFAADGPRPERKICAIGVRVSRRTTMHGFALNLSNAMTPFDNMIPCGISDAAVTTLAVELQHLTSLDGISRNTPTLVEAATALEPRLAEILSFQPYERSPDLDRETSVTSTESGAQIHFR